MQEIIRSKREPVAVVFAPSLGNCGLMAMGFASSFCFAVPASMAGVSTIKFYGAANPNDEFLPIYLSDGTPAEMQATSGNIYVAFPELFSVPLLKATSTVAFTATVMAKG